MTNDTTTETGEFDSLGVALPREWVELPVERSAFDRMCSEMRTRWADDDGWDRTTQRRAELLLSRIRRDLVRHGLQFAASLVSSPTDDDRRQSAPMAVDGAEQDEAADDVIMATCTIGTYTKESFGAKIDLTLGNLTMAFGRRPDADADASGTGSPYRRIVNVEPPMFHELPIGTSVRLRRLYELHEPGVLPQRFYGESYLTPLDPAGGRCVIAHFTTINLDLARLLGELFEAIAGTLTLFGPDDPTAFASEWVDPEDQSPSTHAEHADRTSS